MKLFVILLFFAMFSISYGALLNVIFEWKYVDFVWNSEEQKQQAIKSDNYIPANCVLYDVDKAPDGRMFVTSVREKGVPATLMTITKQTGDSGPLLQPYPNWSWHELGKNSSNTMISVYRVDIMCNYLFVLDSGKIEDVVIQPAQLLIFDLSNDQLVKKVEIPDDVANNENGAGLLVTPIVRRTNPNTSCYKNILNDVVVFMADTEGAGLVVWHMVGNTNTFCRFESEDMKPTNNNFDILGKSFTLNDGILGMTYTNKKLFFAALAGEEIYKIKDSSLTGNCLSHNNIDTDKVADLSGHTGPMASKKCAIFFSNVSETSVLCADVGKEINSNNMVVMAKDSTLLQFISGMKVRDDELWMLSNRLQESMTNTRNINETNYRILKMHMKEICAKYASCFKSCNTFCNPCYINHNHLRTYFCNHVYKNQHILY